LKKLFSLMAKKEAIILIAIVLVIAIYVIFFKPNPIIRVNLNKLRGTNPDSILAFEAPSEVDGVGKSFIVKINMDTKDNFINAVQSYLYFDPQVLEVISTKTSQSFCKFYPENLYDNDLGYIKLSCGSPYPGFNGQNTIQEIEFSAKTINKTSIYLSGESMILANDGSGTNLLSDLPLAEINIKAGL